MKGHVNVHTKSPPDLPSAMVIEKKKVSPLHLANSVLNIKNGCFRNQFQRAFIFSFSTLSVNLNNKTNDEKKCTIPVNEISEGKERVNFLFILRELTKNNFSVLLVF